jgi:predicted GNAT family N-acyltransferase
VHSICFGIYTNEKQIGFARVRTDCVTIAYLMDVFIIEEYRGQGLSKKLLKNVLYDSRFKNVKKWMLATADAHTLYKKFGFNELGDPNKFMERL